MIFSTLNIWFALHYLIAARTLREDIDKVAALDWHSVSRLAVLDCIRGTIMVLLVPARH